MTNTAGLKAPWPKGVSGNPGGRPKGIAAKAREHTEQALKVLTDALGDPDPRVKVTAAKELLDRGWGKSIAMSATVNDPFKDLDDAELDAAIGALREALSLANGGRDGADPQTAH